MNSALQCLLHVPQLVNFARHEMFEGCLFRKRKNACDVATEFAALAKTYWNSGDEQSASGILEAFVRAHRSFKGKRHKNDAAEALTLFVDTLHSALANTERISDHPVPFEGDEDSWNAHINATGYSMILDVFAGQRRLENKSFETFFGLTLDHSVPVTKALGAYDFTRLPLILAITLQKSEDKQFVAYEADMHATENSFVVRYKLFAVLLHHGGADDGHWTALACHADTWTHYDDTACSTVHVNDVVQKNAAMLLYKRLL
jgi:hypothetical protein